MMVGGGRGGWRRGWYGDCRGAAACTSFKGEILLYKCSKPLLTIGAHMVIQYFNLSIYNIVIFYTCQNVLSVYH